MIEYSLTELFPLLTGSFSFFACSRPGKRSKMETFIKMINSLKFGTIKRIKPTKKRVSLHALYTPCALRVKIFKKIFSISNKKELRSLVLEKLATF